MKNKNFLGETTEEYLARGGKIQKLGTHVTTRDVTWTDPKLVSGFYQSQEWRTFRTQIFEKLHKICVVCGATDHLVVDHIKPIRFFWTERLIESNMQILCQHCNLEKGSDYNWDLEHHRKNKKRLSLQRIEHTEFLKYKKEFEREKISRRKHYEQELYEKYGGLSDKQIADLKSGWVYFKKLVGGGDKLKNMNIKHFRQYVTQLHGSLPSRSDIKQYTDNHYLKMLDLFETSTY